MSDNRKILFCSCSRSNAVSLDTRKKVLALLQGAGLDYSVVPDLCGFAVDKPEELSSFCECDSLVVIACQGRAVRSLFDRAGVSLPDNTQFFNMCELSAEDIAEKLDLALDGIDWKEIKLPEYPGEWEPWFPVIDYSRCVNCRQCLNFCLFGTYTLSDEGKVIVSSPSSCKTNCPACARICPEVAIIFPKYPDSPINGGKIEDEAAEKDRVKLDVKKILGSDVYATLAERRKKASKIKLLKENAEKAEAERESFSKDYL